MNETFPVDRAVIDLMLDRCNAKMSGERLVGSLRT